MSFTIHPMRKETFPPFQRPKILGYFSLSSQDRLYSEDLSQLKYYNQREKKKKVQFHLNEGIDMVIRKPKDIVDERIDHMLRWIVNNHKHILADPKEKRWLKPHFICYRGLLTKICSTPFEDRDGWIICAAKFHGNIYLCGFDTDEQKIKKNKLTKRDLQFTSWGFKFEQFLLTDSPGERPNTKQPVNECEEFNCVMTTKLGHNFLLYGAETDGVATEEKVKEPVNWEKLKLVELKTNRLIKTSWQMDFYKKKLFKWWCQSFLVGIEEVVCGTRSDNGIVFEIDTIKVSDMPKISKGFWDATESMNFCEMFLNHMQDVVIHDCDRSIYKFEFKLDGRVNMRILPASSDFSFLRGWYKEQVEKIISTMGVLK